MNRKFYIWLGLIALVGVAVRLAVGFELASFRNGMNSVMMPSIQTDMATYWQISGEIVLGNFKGPFYYQPFYYAVFLPVIRWLLGDSIYAVIVVQSLLGGGAVFLVGLCGRRLWSPSAGLVGAVIAALSKALCLYTPFLMIETLQSFWIILILYLALRGFMRKEPVDWGLCALAVGCSILTRGNSWFFLPGLLTAAVWSLWMQGAPLRKNLIGSFLAISIFLILVFLPQLPFMIHNSREMGKLSGPSTAAGAVLALGNTPEAPPGGREPGLPAGPMEYPPAWHSWMQSEKEMPVGARIWEWFKEEPAAYLELTFRKALLFWDYHEIPNNISMAGEGSHSSFLTYLGIVPTGLLLVLALGGIIGTIISLCHKSNKWLILLPLYMVVAYWGATTLFYMLARFRVPSLPLLAVFAGIFPIWFLELRKKKSQEAYMCGGIALVASVFICIVAYDFYRGKMEPPMMRWARPNGVHMKLNDGRMMYLDNGPMTLGGWQLFPLTPQVAVTKKFAVDPKNSYKFAELELTLFSEYPGRIQVSVNGQVHEFVFAKPDRITQYIPLPKPADTVELKLLSRYEGVFCNVDFQRNYGRTLVGGQVLDGELVCRLFLFNEQPKPPAAPVAAPADDDNQNPAPADSQTIASL